MNWICEVYMVITLAAGIIVLILLILILRTILSKRVLQYGSSIATPEYPEAFKSLAKALQFRTFSNKDPMSIDYTAFDAFHAWLKETYPRLHNQLEKKIIAEHTLLYIWKGRNSGLDPVLFVSHQDVVPAGDEKAWKHPPFAGIIDEAGYLWGRGALDIKSQMMAMIEAVEGLLGESYIPDRDIYLCFGHDEEVGGLLGAKSAAALFKEKGIHFSFLIDEGGAVTEGILPGVAAPVAAVGIGEKGYLDIELSCRLKGGHSSTPERKSALGGICAAIALLEKKPFPLILTEAPRATFREIAPYTPFLQRLVLSNLWLFKPLFLRVLAQGGGTTAAMVRTTAAPTMAQGSKAPNILAERATANINLRMLPGTSHSEALKRVSELVKPFGVTAEAVLYREASKITPIDGREYEIMKETIEKVFSGIITAPYLMSGGTDSINYQEVCDHIFRFCPYTVNSDDLSRIHATNERISRENYGKSILFYTELIRNLKKLG